MFPFVVVSPAYFAGAVQLGGLMQTASAFGSVQNALSFFINVVSHAGGVARGDRAARRLRCRRRRTRSGGGRRCAVDRGRGRRDGCRHHRRSAAPVAATACRSSTADDIDHLAGRPRPGDRRRPAPASRRCSARSPASGRSAMAPSPCRRAPSSWCCRSGRISRSAALAAAVSYPAEPRHLRRRRGWPRRSWPSACRRWPAASTRRRTGTACCRSASSSVSASRARCSRRRTILLLDEATASLDEAGGSRCSTGCSRQRLPRDHRDLDRPSLDARGVPPPHPELIRDGGGRLTPDRAGCRRVIAGARPPPARRPGSALDHQIVPEERECGEQQRADRHRRQQEAARHVVDDHDQRIDAGRWMKGAGEMHRHHREADRDRGRPRHRPRQLQHDELRPKWRPGGHRRAAAAAPARHRANPSPARSTSRTARTSAGRQNGPTAIPSPRWRRRRRCRRRSPAGRTGDT